MKTHVPLTYQKDLAEYEGYLWRAEGAYLYGLAQEVPADRDIVEIGAFKGKSACYLGRGSLAGNHAPVYSVDLWTLGGQGEYVHLGFDLAETYAKYMEQTQKAGVLWHVVRPVPGDSVSVADRWNVVSPNGVGLIFIDGDHRYDSVWSDVRAWLPLMAPGGIVAFHDVDDRFPGVQRCVEEFAAAPSVEYVGRVRRIRAFRVKEVPS